MKLKSFPLILSLSNKKMLFSVRLIIVVPLDTVSDFHIHRLLDNIFQGMVRIPDIIMPFISYLEIQV